MLFLLPPYRLLLADDHLTLSQALAHLLADEPDFFVVGRVTSGSALLAWLQQAAPGAPTDYAPTLPDILLLDLHLPAPDGLTVLPRLRRQWPALRIILYTMADQPAVVARAVAAGAHGFVSKSSESAHLLATIRAVAAGQSGFAAAVQEDKPAAPDPDAAHPAAPPARRAQRPRPDRLLNPATRPVPDRALVVRQRLATLTSREHEVLLLARQGLTNRAIAADLGLSVHTVETHRKRLMKKLGVNGPAALVAFGQDVPT